MAPVTLSEREVAVLCAVFSRCAPPSLSNDEWLAIAHEADITNGDKARRAKYTFSQIKDKIGGKPAAGRGGNTPQKKRKRSEEQAKDNQEFVKSEDEDECTPSSHKNKNNKDFVKCEYEDVDSPVSNKKVKSEWSIDLFSE